MAGYAHDYSKSNNAWAAEQNGILPATGLGKRLGVPAAAIKALMVASEWHHTSKAYNRTDYYDGALLIAIATGREADLADRFDAEEIVEARDLLARLRAWRRPSDVTVYKNCRVEWIEWTGTLKRAKANERKAEGCTVEVKGQTATITLSDGTSFTKRLTTNGFWFNGEKQ